MIIGITLIYWDLFVNIKKNYIDGSYYVEVKDHRYIVHQTEKIILRENNLPTSSRTQYQVQNETRIWKNQKVIKNDNGELEVENYPKNEKPLIQNQQRNFKLPNCSSCKQKSWLEFDKG